jgi:hypothetical protein
LRGAFNAFGGDPLAASPPSQKNELMRSETANSYDCIKSGRRWLSHKTNRKAGFDSFFQNSQIVHASGIRSEAAGSG